MAKPELGGKHKCQNCGAKFFDLNRDPVTCPKCGTTLEATTAAATRSPREERDEEDETENESAGPEVVSLEDADSTDDGKVTTAEDDEDVEVEDDDSGGDDDDTFLEEDEEDSDNVSDLIDGDIEDDEER